MHVEQIQNLRQYQEDRYKIIQNIIAGYDYFSVFDGHGGDAVSELANNQLPNFVHKHLYAGHTPVKALYNAFEDLHKIISYDIGDLCGSAAVVALKKNNDLYIANTGDSRAICKNSGITIDHKPNLDKEYNRIIKDGGAVLNIGGVPRLNGDLALSRSFGDFRLSPVITWKPDIYTTKYDGLLVLASDGLWDVMSNKEVSDAFSNVHKSQENVCNELITESILRGSQDNITILVV